MGAGMPQAKGLALHTHRSFSPHSLLILTHSDHIPFLQNPIIPSVTCTAVWLVDLLIVSLGPHTQEVLHKQGFECHFSSLTETK